MAFLKLHERLRKHFTSDRTDRGSRYFACLAGARRLPFLRDVLISFSSMLPVVVLPVSMYIIDVY